MAEDNMTFFDKTYMVLTHPTTRNPLIYGGFSGTAMFAATFMWKGLPKRSFLSAMGTTVGVFWATQVYERHDKVVKKIHAEKFKDYVVYDKWTKGTDRDESLYEKPINYGRRY